MTENGHHRIAVITGGAGALGSAFAIRLAREGCDIAIADLSPADNVVAEIEAAGRTGYGEICDLADPAAISRFGTNVRERFGHCDILVNNAAYMKQISFDALTIEQWRMFQAVNVDAAFLMCKEFVPGMVERSWGRIVNLASSSLWGPPPGFLAYSTSKMSNIGLTRALAAELGVKGITVNAISPGLTRHERSQKSLPEEAFAFVRQRQFIKRTEEPEDLCGALAFLASDDSAFITGQVFNVDGGGFGF